MTEAREWSLYSGPDLKNADEFSTAGRDIQGIGRGMGNAVGILSDAISARFRGRKSEHYELSVTRGVITGCSGELTSCYVGNGSNRAWWIDTQFARHKEIERVAFTRIEDLLSELAEHSKTVNFLIADGVDISDVRDIGVESISTPAWIKQRLRILPTWAAQIAAMRRGTRQEVARALRRDEYECHVTSNSTDFEHFYDCLYRPHVRARFGDSAVIVERKMFIRECRRGVLLQLSFEGNPCAAVLLRRVGTAMAIVWSGAAGKSADKMPGHSSDVLDYFSLLYAKLSGCWWLDFGPSRADLDDGLLRYKRKWNTELTTGWIPQNTIHWSCLGRHDDEWQFLRQHGLLTLAKGSIRALLFIDGHTEIERLQARISTRTTPGVDEYCVIAVPKLETRQRNTLAAICSNMRFFDAAEPGEAFSIAANLAGG